MFVSDIHNHPGESNFQPFLESSLDFLIEHGFAHRVDSLNAYVGCGQIGTSHKSYFLICTYCGNAAGAVS